MEELIKAMSNSDLAKLRQKHATNETVTKLIDGILEARQREVEQQALVQAFEAQVTELFANLPHPDFIHNVCGSWREVEEPIPDSVPEVIYFKDGIVTTNQEEANSQEERYPMQKVSKWVVETNKGFRVSGSGGDGNGKASTSKRAITVYKREGLTLANKGNYASASKACEKLGIVVGSDSATRVLHRDNYITEPYEGTDFIS